ncbi:MAG: hypothetical protein M3P48_02145 [Actinomycetota bacterium]|nr:hypothetical protein [Actinomycetota bacterium]
MSFLRLPGARRRLSRGERAGVPLEPGERILTWGRDAGGRLVVATGTRLLVPTEPATSPGRHARSGGIPRWDPLPWHRMSRAQWDRTSMRFVIDVIDEVSGHVDTRLIGMQDESRLPETVRERVMSTIVLTRHVKLMGRYGARIVARRVPAESEPEWQLILDPGLDPGDPDVRERAEAALDDVRREAPL